MKSPHPLTKETAPVGVGHEFSGTVIELGSSVSDGKLQVGDHVACQPTLCCWDKSDLRAGSGCDSCAHGHINICGSGGFVGLSGGGGGVSDAVCIDQQFVFKLPQGIPLDVGALVEPLAVAWHAVDQYEIKQGDAALVLGAGPIGLSIVQVLKARGAEKVIVAEVAKERQRFAREFGATHILNPVEEDVVEKVKELTGGVGVDVALDAAGVPASLKTAFGSVRTRGTVVNVAIWEKEVPFNPNLLVFGEKIYKAGEFGALLFVGLLVLGVPFRYDCDANRRAVLGYLQKDFAGVIKALEEGKLKPVKMITSKIKIDRVVEDGYNA